MSKFKKVGFIEEIELHFIALVAVCMVHKYELWTVFIEIFQDLKTFFNL